MPKKDWMTALLLSIFLGGIGGRPLLPRVQRDSGS